jgi:glycosyltransferase involved in cell wall biosynthesis
MRNISIAITAHNEEQYIKRAIRSCLNQTYPRTDFEIVCVDNGSTDNTLNILKDLKDFYSGITPIKIIELESNTGIGFGSLTALGQCKGQFVVRIDGDDYISERLLDVETLFLSQNKEFDAVSCDYFKVDDNENVLSRCDGSLNPIACGVMYRTDRLIKVGGYNPNKIEDEDKELRNKSNFKIYNIPIPLYRYRRHSNNTSKVSPHV